jgi:hypothetical protein
MTMKYRTQWGAKRGWARKSIRDARAKERAGKEPVDLDI